MSLAEKTAGTTATADGPLWDGIVTLHGRVEARLAKALQRRHGIGLSEYRALCRLSRAEDHELRMQELADLIGLNQSSVSRLVARLEAAGLTRRAMCPKDRRGVYSVITDEGLAVLDKASPTYVETLTEALDTAAKDPTLAPLLATLRPV
ncbi:MarR family winged helix-turn-helix transcriptional regulator [Actinomadura madurae]|uniref:MarR family winged helix-turn-helix transcriptional regulator n=1 Tax=Actinomadura madurae TaxID=1993 RepID=UPI00202764D8|nr:MarR family transcriptional regulator [Actinomadura madurae]MCP9952064.1 MarR family transcriptional regulator [Actinomadura madurae]MCP9968825.1 MarR family transcriptional regulator [Actinomadura madurae]MCP9981304.1 MarR family transcriptional regulator [Actinomadura madurae]MCQ0007191.1 MarR family transcriptional regulator [Actinomadura madurae]MCQ0017500.1 MarR family transcriptional regulator [Actinomadura madurae]